MSRSSANAPPRRPLGNTGLQCHPLGFGCYRVLEGNSTHEAALREYLERGGNLIDTSANYGDGRSELLVGQALQEFPQDQVIVVTKGGYIQGQNMALALQHQFPEVVEYGEDLWHSIHPEFLETQIRRSAHRLRRHTLDVYLLHNPEYYLEDQGHRGQVGEKQHREFYRRVREAFRFLEDKVTAGEIRWYGVSSNNFVLPASGPALTSIRRCWEAAESVSPQHHFRVVQLPLNLYESGGALEPSHEGKTALEFCRAKGIGVLVNRPLNAFFGNRMVRLADFLRPGEKPPGREQLRALLAPLLKMEQELEEQFAIALLYGSQRGIADYLETIIPQIAAPAQWEQALYPYVIQPIERWAVQCQQLYGEKAEWQEWWRRFSQMFPSLLEETARFIAGSQQAVSDEVRAQLKLAGYPDDSPPPEGSGPQARRSQGVGGQGSASLSRKELNLLLCLEGVSCVLVGMRRPEYVEDSLGALELDPVDSLSILSRFRRMYSQELAQPQR